MNKKLLLLRTNSSRTFFSYLTISFEKHSTTTRLQAFAASPVTHIYAHHTSFCILINNGIPFILCPMCGLHTNERECQKRLGSLTYMGIDEKVFTLLNSITCLSTCMSMLASWLTADRYSCVMHDYSLTASANCTTQCAHLPTLFAYV